MTLLSAVEQNDKKQVEEILRLEKEGQAPKSDYNESLKCALLYDKIDIAELLILAGADVNAENGLNSLVKEYVILKEYECVKLLVKHKAKLSSELLELALNYDHIDIAALLIIEGGLDPNGTTTDPRLSLLEYYVASNKHKIVEFLLKTNLIRVNEYPPLFTLCQDDGEMPKLILKCGYDINECGKNSESSLFHTIRFTKNQKMLNFLCENSADLNKPNKFNHIPLAVAIDIRNYQAAELLLQAGANPLLLPKKSYLKLLQNKSAEALALYQAILKQAKEALGVKTKLEQMTNRTLMTLPPEIVNLDYQKLRDLLRDKIKTSHILPEIAEKLYAFLDSSTSLPTKALSRFHLVSELLELIQHPEIINQRKTNLCGPAAFLALVVSENPSLIIDMAIDLITGTNKTKKPFLLTLSAFSRNKSQSIIEILLLEIRRAENWTGYSPTSAREGFQGLTAPRTLSKWLEAVGCEEVEDRTEVVSYRGKPLIKPVEMLLNTLFFGFHKKGYQKFPKDRMIEFLIGAVENQKSIILLVSRQMMKKIKNESVTSKGADISISSKTTGYHLGCCIPIDHWVYIKNFRMKENNEICLEILTYGDIFKVQLPNAYFLEQCRGGIFMKGFNKKTAEKSIDQSNKVLLDRKERVEAQLAACSAVAGSDVIANTHGHRLDLDFSFNNSKRRPTGFDASQSISTVPDEHETIRARKNVRNIGV